MTEFASERDKVGAIQVMVDAPGWSTWFHPTVAARMKQTMEALASKRGPDDDVQRGWFQALRWVLNLPAQEIESYKLTEREASKTQDTQAEDDYRARFGYRSPFKRAPEPGETKTEDTGSDTTSPAIGD